MNLRLTRSVQRSTRAGRRDRRKGLARRGPWSAEACFRFRGRSKRKQASALQGGQVRSPVDVRATRTARINVRTVHPWLTRIGSPRRLGNWRAVKHSHSRTVIETRSRPPLIDTNRIERLGRQERAILVGVILPHRDGTPDDPLDELRGLAKTAGLIVVGTMLQKRHQIDIATYIGSGKVEELKNAVEAHEADVVLFDNDLSPAQTRNLEKQLGVKVVDRTEVILDIFATHALTHEAHLQVELAQLEYAMPRLKRMWTHLSRYKGGIGSVVPAKSSSKKTAAWSVTAFRSSRASSARSRRGRSERSPAAATCRPFRWSATPTPAKARS